MTTQLTLPPPPAMIGRRSTTARVLNLLRRWLLGLTVVVLGLTVTVYTQIHGTVDTAARQSLPAVMAVSAAGEALGKADSDAMASFATGTIRITGPGSDYQTQFTLATQSLEQVAEANQAGGGGTEDLLLVEQELAEYRQGIERADATYSRSNTELGYVEAFYASQEMHNQVLPELASLRDLETHALAGQVSSVWLSPWAAALWIVPSGALIVLMLVAQVYLRRRFRRLVNGWLVGGTLALVLVILAMTTTFRSEHRLREAATGVAALVHDRTLSYRPAPVSSPPSATAAGLEQHCRTDTTGCGVAQATAGDQVQDGLTNAVVNAANAADENLYLQFVIPAAGLAVAASVLLGFHPRTDEYRRRET